MNQSRIHPVLPLAMAALVLTGCGGGSLPTHVLKLTPESLQNRTLQTRKFEGISEADLLSASTGVIQDLGFIIDESEPGLGLIVGSKYRDAPPDVTQRVLQAIAFLGMTAGTILAIFSGDVDGLDEAWDTALSWVDAYQTLWATIVIGPASGDDDETFHVRVTFQRIVWNARNEIARLQSLDEPEFYQKFFDLLSKSVFLEGRDK